MSGGLDSTTVLAMAKAAGYACYTLSFDYGQRHRAELLAAERVSAALGDIEHKVVRLNLDSIGGSALTDTNIAVPEEATEGIPVTYVPARNTVFLSIALGWAEVLGASDIFIGVNAVDYSGYPDCRPEYIAAFETMANLATRAGVEGQPTDHPHPADVHGQGGYYRGRHWPWGWITPSPSPATRPQLRAWPAASVTAAACAARASLMRACRTPPAT